jgi:uncharacterized membrane protein
MADPASPPPLSRRSWGRITLVVALVLSLFLNALAVGAWLRFRDVRADFLGPEGASARLPLDLRQELLDALRAEAPRIRPLLSKAVEARIAIVAAASARPYDRADAEAAMVDFRTSLDALLAEVQLVFLDRLDTRANE